ncbi:MAG: glycoside hydrolase family protein [Candidatus Binataceae bacterium]
MPSFSNSISYPVGDARKGAVNRHDEVKVVQGLLNVQIIKDGRSDRLLQITGTADSATLSAIIDFQRRRGFPQDGVIHPYDTRHPEFGALRTFSGPRGMRTSQTMIEFIEKFEHFEPNLYNDAANNATIGYGHKVHNGPVNHWDSSEGPFKNGISRPDADTWFASDLEKDGEDPVHDSVEVPLTQNQFDALVSLAFNVKRKEFEGSTLLKMLNGTSHHSYYTGDYLSAAKEFPRWDKIKVGERLETSSGLYNRRRQEEEIFSRR